MRRMEITAQATMNYNSRGRCGCHSGSVAAFQQIFHQRILPFERRDHRKTHPAVMTEMFSILLVKAGASERDEKFLMTTNFKNH